MTEQVNNYYKSSYHSSRKKWRSHNYSPKGMKIGIELEVEHPNGYHEAIKRIPKFRSYMPDFEEDMSLDYRRGVEIIFPPLSPSTIRNKNSTFSRAIKAIDESGVEDSDRCGMHMNVNTSDWEWHKINRFGQLVLGLPRHVLENIGGRTLTRYCGMMHWYYLDDWYEYAEESHDYAVSFRRNRLELRFPASTTCLRKINLLVYFIEAVAKVAERAVILTDNRDSNSSNLAALVELSMPRSKKRDLLCAVLRSERGVKYE